jgi:cbb3-type cytochrome oxidase maturation protein
MESLYLLLPLSVLLVLALIGVFGWAINAGQFEDLEREGWRVLEDEPLPPPQPPALDLDQASAKHPYQQSQHGI